MFYDLPVQPHMTPIVGMLYSAVEHNYKRLQNITAGITQHELDYKGPLNNFNSIGQLIKHLTYVDLRWVYRIKGEHLSKALEEEFGPMIDTKGHLPMINGISIHTLFENYENVINALEDVCRALTDDDLKRIVTFGHHNEKQATIRWGIWHIADHSRYHQAHINQLRRWYKEDLISD